MVSGQARWVFRRPDHPPGGDRRGTTVVYAPHWIDDEVRKHAPRIAADAGVTEEVFLATWETYRADLRVFGPTASGEGMEPADVADAKDLPCVDLCFEVGAAAVYSEDERHLTRMGVPVVKKAYVTDLRDYSRAAAIRLTVTVGGSTAIRDQRRECVCAGTLGVRAPEASLEPPRGGEVPGAAGRRRRGAASGGARVGGTEAPGRPPRCGSWRIGLGRSSPKPSRSTWRRTRRLAPRWRVRRPASRSRADIASVRTCSRCCWRRIAR
jgi:hypothetical protein